MNKIRDCKIITGDIVINDYKEPIIEFGNIMNIFGNLDIQRASSLVRIEADNVHRIGNRFILKDLTSLNSISFSSLRYVKVVDWKVLPILNVAHFGNAIKETESVTVSDTSLVEFPGFLSNKLEILDINNNRYLESIYCNVEKITGRLHIAANSKDVRVSLPKLQSAKNVSIHEVLDLDLNNLEEIESSINFVNNLFINLSLPVLKSIGGTLSLLKNENLGKVEFPNVTEIGGGLMIVNNTKIDRINFYPKLTIIGGAIELVGNIKETNLKNLKLVKGSAKIKSSDSSFDCTKWTKSELSSVIRGGKIECINANNERITADTPTEGGNNDTEDNDDYSVKLASKGVTLNATTNLKYILLLFILMLIT